MIEVNAELSIRCQCQLIGLPLSSYYYQPAGENEFNLMLMRLIDEQYLKTPFFGILKMTDWLKRQGYEVNHKRVERLMRTMGLQGAVPEPHTSQSHPEHTIYPYLLKGMTLEHANLVWSTDLTYIPMANGFMYLTAVIDWYSRYVLAWHLSNTMDVETCIAPLHQALEIATPCIFNTDQGSQYTSNEFTGLLKKNEILISMDGRGRALDNVFIERLWRSVKYEEIYLYRYETVPELEMGLQRYFDFYNYQRPHQALNGQTPAEIHFRPMVK